MAEEAAANYLLRNGFSILKRNWRYHKAEVDIIARKQDIIHIVEVKARHSDIFLAPEDAVDKKKINLLITAADAFVENIEDDVEVQFDIIAILLEEGKLKLDFIENAFESID